MNNWETREKLNLNSQIYFCFIFCANRTKKVRWSCIAKRFLHLKFYKNRSQSEIIHKSILRSSKGTNQSQASRFLSACFNCECHLMGVMNHVSFVAIKPHLHKIPALVIVSQTHIDYVLRVGSSEIIRGMSWILMNKYFNDFNLRLNLISIRRLIMRNVQLCALSSVARI